MIYIFISTQFTSSIDHPSIIERPIDRLSKPGSLAVCNICHQSRPAAGAARHFRLQYSFNIDMSMRLQLVRTRQFRNQPAPFICASNARPVATAVAAAERSIDSCNAKQSNEPCCALFNRLDTSL